jgi:hypothetical protein
MMEFVYRPKPIDAKNFEKRKNVLLPIVLKLRDDYKNLDNERVSVDQFQGLSGYIRRF